MEYRNFLFQFLVTLFSSIICFIVQRELDRFEMKRLASIVTEFIDFDIFDFNAIRKYDLFRRQRKDKRKRISSDISKKDGSREEDLDDAYDYSDHKMNVLDAYPEFANLVKKLHDLGKKVDKLDSKGLNIGNDFHELVTQFITTSEKNFKEIDGRYNNIMEINQKLIDTNHTLEKSYETKHNNLLCSIDQLKKEKEMLITQNMGLRLDINNIKKDINELKQIKISNKDDNISENILNDSELLIKKNEFIQQLRLEKNQIQTEIMTNMENAVVSEEFVSVIIEKVEDSFVKSLDDNKIFDKYVNKFSYNVFNNYENKILAMIKDFKDLVENEKLKLAENSIDKIDINSDVNIDLPFDFNSNNVSNENDFHDVIMLENEIKEDLVSITPVNFVSNDDFYIKKVLNGEIKSHTVTSKNTLCYDQNDKLEYFYKFGSDFKTYRLKESKLYSTYY